MLWRFPASSLIEKGGLMFGEYVSPPMHQVSATQQLPNVYTMSRLGHRSTSRLNFERVLSDVT